MQKLALLMTGLVLWPVAAHAQRATVGTDGFAVTVFTGARSPFTTGFVNVFDQEGQAIFSVREERGGNPVLGLEGEIRVWGPLSVIAGTTYSQAGVGEFFLGGESPVGRTGDFAIHYVSDTWFTKVGLAARFLGEERFESRRRLATDLFVAPALVRQFDSNHPALNFGFKGAVPVRGAPVEVSFGLENYFVFWDREALAPITLSAIRPFHEDAVDVDLLYNTSHLPVLRIGATWRP